MKARTIAARCFWPPDIWADTSRRRPRILGITLRHQGRAVPASLEQRRFEYENADEDPVGPRPRLQAVRPAAAGSSLSVVHEMTLVQDLCAAAHQRGQVLVCVVAAEVQLATRRHRRTNPGASAAGVATIRRVQLRLVQYGAFKSLCVHASITHHRPAPRTPVHPGRNRPPDH